MILIRMEVLGPVTVPGHLAVVPVPLIASPTRARITVGARVAVVVALLNITGTDTVIPDTDIETRHPRKQKQNPAQLEMIVCRVMTNTRTNTPLENVMIMTSPVTTVRKPMAREEVYLAHPAPHVDRIPPHQNADTRRNQYTVHVIETVVGHEIAIGDKWTDFCSWIE